MAEKGERRREKEEAGEAGRGEKGVAGDLVRARKSRIACFPKGKKKNQLENMSACLSQHCRFPSFRAIVACTSSVLYYLLLLKSLITT